MNDLTTTSNHEVEPFRRAQAAPGGNVGAMTIESERAIAEVQGQLVLAKRFPRSMTAAQIDFLDACKSPEFAATAFYAVPNRGSGPSIRFAEEVARCYGNFDYGHRELSRTEAGINGPGKSEIEVYAWDKEKNNRSTRQITVIHVTDTKNGPKRLIDQTDIDNKIANVASKQMRGRILALVPKAIVAAGVLEAKRTIAGGNEKPLSQRIIGLCNGFAKYGVSTERLAKYLGHSVDDITIDEFADLVGIGSALKEGGKASEFFPSDAASDDAAPSAAVKAITEAAKPKPAAATKPRAAAVAESKPAEKVSKAVKDEAPAAVKEAAQDEQSHAEPDQSMDAANAAADSADDGPEDDVF